MHIVAFWGSTSSTSINKKLVLHTLRYFPDAKVTLLDLSNYEMPIFSVDREREGTQRPHINFIESLNRPI